jgi:hypothetical protein
MAQITAFTNAEPSTNIDIDTENHLDADSGYDISGDTDQTMGGSSMTKAKETGQHVRSPDNRLELG